MSTPETPCPSTCPIDRAVFLRSTSAALAALAAAGFAPAAAFADGVDTISPLKSQGRMLTYALPAKDGAQIDDASGVIVARVKNAVWAFAITCPHRSTTHLEWHASDNEFFCPKHKAHFESNGKLIEGRPDRSMDRYAIARVGQTITVDTGTVYQEDTAADNYAKAVITV